MNRITFLENPVMTYPWGSPTAIPELLGRDPGAAIPQAEMWMGAHPKAPSTVVRGERRLRLDTLIRDHPVDLLGKEVAEKFGNRLPYLFKVLAAEKPLSIQAHPSAEQAQHGYRRENALGLLPDDPRRNYRDASHKPECICALTPFWALNGFRSVGQITANFDSVFQPFGELRPLTERLKKVLVEKGLREWFGHLVSLAPESRHTLVRAAVRHARHRSPQDPVSRWMVSLFNEYPDDIGVLSPLFLNLIRLAPGEAMFLPAGEMHAYFHGVGIEVMANSDNVLRGGLTTKHVDVPELLKSLNFSSRRVAILNPQPAIPFESVYSTTAEEFALSVIATGSGDVYRSLDRRGIEILLCTEGAGQLKSVGGKEALPFRKGSSLLVPAAAAPYEIQGEALLYKASVPRTAP